MYCALCLVLLLPALQKNLLEEHEKETQRQTRFHGDSGTGAGGDEFLALGVILVVPAQQPLDVPVIIIIVIIINIIVIHRHGRRRHHHQTSTTTTTIAATAQTTTRRRRTKAKRYKEVTDPGVTVWVRGRKVLLPDQQHHHHNHNSNNNVQ